MVAAIVAGDPEGIAEAYDRYALSLYSYCRSLLHEPADAADAVQDTFLIATSKLGGLRDPGKLRSWLYAVARNECYRRLRAGEATSALDEAGDMTAEADVASAIEHAEVQQFVRDAIAGLNPSERDVIELSLVQGLDSDELADALGVSRNHAHALVSRARSQLERSLGALLVARTGREACAALGALLAGWDGQLTVLMRKRVSRHIDQCGICGELKRRELSPALFAGALPLVALLPGFREHVLKMCADLSSAGLARRASVGARAGQFGPSGFPQPSLPPGVSGWHRILRHSHALAASAAAAAAAAGVSAVLILGGGAPQSHAPGAGARGTRAPERCPTPAVLPPAARAVRPAPGGAGWPRLRVRGGRPCRRCWPRARAHTRRRERRVPPPPRRVRRPPGPPPRLRPRLLFLAPLFLGASVQGTLAVSLSRLVLVAVNGHGVGTFTLTAKGGPVRFSISAAAGLTLSPASGSLSAWR